MVSGIAIQYQKIQLISILILSKKKMSCSIWPRDGTLSGTTTPSYSGPGNNGNEVTFPIFQSSKTRVSLLDGLVSYPDHL